MGGIATINDVLEFIMAGATDIAMGIANFNNHFVMPEIISELSKYMKENNVETLDEIRVLLVKNQEEIIMHYTGTIWRPPYEAYSLLVQVTAGCTHHSCKFCTLYEDLPFKFKLSPFSEVKADLAEASKNYRKIPRIFFT